MPFLNENEKPSFLDKPSLSIPQGNRPPQKNIAGKNFSGQGSQAPLKVLHSNDNQDPLGAQHLQRKQLYRDLLKNPDVHAYAKNSGKEIWEVAKELTEHFPEKEYGSVLHLKEIKKQLEYVDPLRYRHQQQAGTGAKKYEKLKEEREKHGLLEKIFGLRKKP